MSWEKVGNTYINSDTGEQFQTIHYHQGVVYITQIGKEKAEVYDLTKKEQLKQLTNSIDSLPTNYKQIIIQFPLRNQPLFIDASYMNINKELISKMLPTKSNIKRKKTNTNFDAEDNKPIGANDEKKAKKKHFCTAVTENTISISEQQKEPEDDSYANAKIVPTVP